ncbi:DUF2630 family protein [Streptomyces sp. NPDC060205]|uniref:DUF2630 family protein n=1 Tax=Streptomyces sp. NPDC060205 TaxID=3347072 RepID=UPI0036574FA2
MGPSKNDAESAILGRISTMVGHEKVLRAQLAEGAIDGHEEHVRLAALERELDQCWDLLRQRRALKGAGADPEEAQVRTEGTVEGYLS